MNNWVLIRDTTNINKTNWEKVELTCEDIYEMGRRLRWLNQYYFLSLLNLSITFEKIGDKTDAVTLTRYHNSRNGRDYLQVNKYRLETWGRTLIEEIYFRTEKPNETEKRRKSHGKSEIEKDIDYDFSDPAWGSYPSEN